MQEINIQTFPDSWSLLERINFIQRKILLNSILYYDYNKNAITDQFYDGMCNQLVRLHNEYSKIGNIKEDTRYGYIYYDFDGSTGYHLCSRLSGADHTYMQCMTFMYLDKI